MSSAEYKNDLTSMETPMTQTNKKKTQKSCFLIILSYSPVKPLFLLLQLLFF